VDPNASWPEVSVDVAVGQMRAIEFYADVPGDWAVHCHKSHHTMNAMGHDVRTYIGVTQKDIAQKIKTFAPGYMPMGSAGMGEMGSMEMPLPDNTLPMMTGYAQFGPVEMGGMFTVMKVRPGLAANDYKDPGWYKHPEGTVAYEWTGPKLAEPPRRNGPASGKPTAEFRAIDRRKRRVRTAGRGPASGGGHGNH
ncbi:MAG TPA: multicopper oxidase domain-containing protein, partial [Microvirga sp.]|nr:multicopper oxidase domain-containing protein [Microvirga sp.]